MKRIKKDCKRREENKFEMKGNNSVEWEAKKTYVRITWKAKKDKIRKENRKIK